MKSSYDAHQVKAVIVGGDISLSTILDGKAPHPLDLESFREYCKKRLVDENLDFWVLVERSLKKNEDPTTYCRLIDYILDTFISDTSAKEINIPNGMKNELLIAAAKSKQQVMSNMAKPNLTIFDDAQRHVFHMLNTDVLPGFKQMCIVKQRLHLAYADALWWRKKITWSEFFSFPNPVNSAESRIHYSLTCIWIICGIITHYFTGSFWVFLPMFIGFLMRSLCGPRLDPQAFLVLFVIRPFVTDWLGIFHTEFVAGPPKRFGQTVGAAFSLTTFLLLYFNQQIAGYIVAGIFFIAAFLGSFFDFCLACECFKLGMKWGIVPASVCQECSLNYLSACELPSAKSDSIPITQVV